MFNVCLTHQIASFLQVRSHSCDLLLCPQNLSPKCPIPETGSLIPNHLPGCSLPTYLPPLATRLSQTKVPSHTPHQMPHTGPPGSAHLPVKFIGQGSLTVTNKQAPSYPFSLDLAQWTSLTSSQVSKEEPICGTVCFSSHEHSKGCKAGKRNGKQLRLSKDTEKW